jgi:small subunit ribosomal protein S20
MVKNLSAIKKDQVSLRNNIRNKTYKSTIKTLVKKITVQMDRAKSMNSEDISMSLGEVYSKIDKAVKIGVISKNSAARKKSRLSKRLKNILKQ